MTTIENPPAFPIAMIPEWSEGAPGMDLRDYFAGRALPAAIAAIVAGKAPLENWSGTPAQTASSIAYIMADAMLAERVAKP